MSEKKFGENKFDAQKIPTGGFTTASASTYSYHQDAPAKLSYADVVSDALHRDMRSPLSRRRALGDTANSYNVDTPGFWVHVTTDAAGVPKEAKVLEVDDTVTQWRYCDEEAYRSIDRLPKVGVYVFLY